MLPLHLLLIEDSQKQRKKREERVTPSPPSGVAAATCARAVRAAVAAGVNADTGALRQRAPSLGAPSVNDGVRALQVLCVLASWLFKTVDPNSPRVVSGYDASVTNDGLRLCNVVCVLPDRLPTWGPFPFLRPSFRCSTPFHNVKRITF